MSATTAQLQSQIAALRRRLEVLALSGGGGGSLPLGGTSGQVLTKQSATDGDAGWEDIVLDGGGP